jgi:predicted aspartyl protease
MGTFSAKIRILDSRDRRREEEVEAMIDTGAGYSWLSRQRLQSLGVSAGGRLNFRTIEGHLIEREVAPVFVAFNGRTGGDTVVVGEPGDMEVWGAHTLESLGLAVDPVQKKLIPTVGLALSVN